MDSKKPLNVGVSSSLIDLKAELLRKQHELKSSRSGKSAALKTTKKSDLLKAKSKEHGRNVGVDNRSQKDRLKAAEEEKTLEKSRSVLEAKAKLYEKMQASALVLDNDDEDVESATSHLFAQSLVNFQQKAIDEIKERRQEDLYNTNKRKLEVEDDDKVKLYPEDDDEWTEFTDALGRTRRCLKSDLPSFIERDDKLVRPENPGICLSASADDRLREMKREKWELEAELLAAKEKVHYQDIMYDEVRTHGTGYYKFDRDESVRAQQMKELKKLSEQTAANREKIKKNKSSKNAQLKAKILKIKNKKRAKQGLPPLPEDPSDDEEEEEQKTDKQEEESKDETKPKETRAWDFGKPGVFGPRPTTFDELDEKWLKDRRADRNPDFAPPKSVYSQGGLRKAYGSSDQNSSTSSSSGKYQNFIKSRDSLPSTSYSAVPPPNVVIEPPAKPFQAPQNFWKQRQDANYSQPPPRAPPQKPIPIHDELPAPIPESSEEFDRGRGGVEVAPPPTFEYYHGETKPKGRPNKVGRSDEDVHDAISSGLKALREQFEAKQQQQGNKEGKHFSPFL